MLYVYEVRFTVLSTGEVLTRGEWAGRESSAVRTIEDAYGKKNVLIHSVRNLSKAYQEGKLSVKR